MKPELYKGFKKVKEDERTATFQHEKGHTLTLVKGGLVGSERNKLSKLPLYQAEGSDEPIQSDESDQGQSPDVNASEAGTGKAVNITINSAPQQPAQDPNKPQYLPQPQPAMDKIHQDYLKREADEKAADDARMQAYQNQTHSTAPLLAADMKAPTLAPPPMAPAPVPNHVPASVSAAPAAPVAQPAMAPAPVEPQGPQLSNQLEDLNKQYQQNVKHQQDADAEFQSEMAKDQGIDPRRVFNNMSTGRKISTAIGLILGGIGGGITGQENPAMKLLNKEIDNDVMAQKEDRSNKFSLFKMHMQSLGDQTASILQTQNNLKQAAIVKMDEALGTVGNNPMAKQRILAAKTQLQNDIANNQLQLAQHHTMQQYYSAQGKGKSAELPDAIDPNVSSSFRVAGKKYYTNDTEAAKKARDQAEAIESLENSASAINAFNKQHGTTGYGFPTELQGHADTLNNLSKGAIAKLEASGGNIGRLAPLFMDSMPVAGAWTQSKQKGKAAGIDEAIRQAKKSLLDTYTLKGQAPIAKMGK